MARREPDKGEKWLIQHYGDAILRLAGTTGMRRWKALQAELVQTKQLPDGLLEVFFANEHQPNYYLLEIASHPEKRILEQALDDLTLAYQHLRCVPELITVILTEKGRFRVTGEHLLQSRRGLSELSIRWRVVELWTLSAEELLAANEVGLIPWVPLTKFEGEPADLFVQCRQRIERLAPVQQQDTLLGISHVLASLRYTEPELLGLFGGSGAMLEFPLIQKYVKEAKQEMRQEDIIEVLAARFGEVPEEIGAKLSRIRKKQRLHDLVRYAAICPDLKAFQARLRS